MYDGYEHLARVHVYEKCAAIDVTWTEIEGMLATGEVIEEHVFNDLMVKEIRLLLDWSRPLHLVYIVHHDRRLVVYRTIYVPTLEEWRPGFRERRK
ncbi:hypothetical protein [Nocardioides sp. AE5]|uniref:hypothetical protein n=1 Tax=Nocardioides sp. AE5 TaxID=2962573 RepID=UPI0028820CF4|nr:hypothetical protein [Nocardioides sp. AE5]MDT0203023.1 hypothetical protein [Nocardioides sp. AE5]